jgi:hypothetical protein
VRDPAVPSEAKRERDAIDAARVSLRFMIGLLHIHDEKNPAEATFYSAVHLVTLILNDADANKLVRKHAPAPGARDKILSALRPAPATAKAWRTR